MAAAGGAAAGQRHGELLSWHPKPLASRGLRYTFPEHVLLPRQALQLLWTLPQACVVIAGSLPRQAAQTALLAGAHGSADSQRLWPPLTQVAVQYLPLQQQQQRQHGELLRQQEPCRLAAISAGFSCTTAPGGAAATAAAAAAFAAGLCTCRCRRRAGGSRWRPGIRPDLQRCCWRSSGRCAACSVCPS